MSIFHCRERMYAIAALLSCIVVAGCSGSHGAMPPNSQVRVGRQDVGPGSAPYEQLIKSANPKQYYELEDTACANDDPAVATVGISGTYDNDVACQVTGPLSGETNFAISLPGWTSNNAISMGASLPSPGVSSGDWTVEDWVNPTYGNAEQYLTVWAINAPDFLLINNSSTSGNYRDLLTEFQNYDFFSTKPLSSSGWHLIDVVYADSTKTLTYYIDGQTAGSHQYASSITFNSAYYLGQYTTTNGVYKYDGSIAQHAVYASALSAAVISSHYTMPTPPPPHVPTWAYDETGAEGGGALPAQVQQYLTYAEGGDGNTKAQTDCSGSGKCYSVFYFDPNHIYYNSNCPEIPDVTASASETWWVHFYPNTDFANRLQQTQTRTCKGSQVPYTIYLLNDGYSAVEAFFAQYLQSTADTWDYYFMDDTSTSVKNEAYGPGSFCAKFTQPQTYCGPQSATEWYSGGDSAVLAAHRAFLSQLKHTNGQYMHVFFNGLCVGNGCVYDNHALLTGGTNNPVGASCEGCPIGDDTISLTQYPSMLNTMAEVNSTPGAQFVELDTGAQTAGSASQINEREIAVGLLWLGFADGHEVLWENLEDNTTNLAAFPEEMLYPTNPVQTMTAGASDLEVAPGVYRREFSECYNDQTPFGPCAVIVNGNSTSVSTSATWLTATYGHEITFVGGDILSGHGTINTAGASYSSGATIPSGGALLLSQ